MSYEVSYKTLIDAKPLHIILSNVDWFTIDYNGTKYLILFDSEKYNAVFNKNRYLISIKSNISYFFSYSYAKVTIDSDDNFPLQKTLTLHNAVILIKSVVNKNQNQYYYNVFLENFLHQLPNSGNKIV